MAMAPDGLVSHDASCVELKTDTDAQTKPIHTHKEKGEKKEKLEQTNKQKNDRYLVQ